MLIAVAMAQSRPFNVRVDLQEAQAGSSLLVSLDEHVGIGPNLSVMWALPPELSPQSSFAVIITKPTGIFGANATIVTSGVRTGAAQSFSEIARSSLQPNTAYDLAVRVNQGAWCEPLRFFTSAGASAWAQSSPVWPASCGAAGTPRHAPTCCSTAQHSTTRLQHSRATHRCRNARSPHALRSAAHAPHPRAHVALIQSRRKWGATLLGMGRAFADRSFEGPL